MVVVAIVVGAGVAIPGDRVVVVVSAVAGIVEGYSEKAGMHRNMLTFR